MSLMQVIPRQSRSQRLAPAKRRKIVHAKARIIRHEEFIQLRRGYGSARKHRMHLTAMVLTVQEKIHQRIGQRLDLDARLVMDMDGAGKVPGLRTVT
jgi:hypothetical protein